jgi:NADH:ubiquinone reductase (H+-translocating)
MRKILIVGGGYAGFYTAWKLEKKLRSGEAQVTVIDARPYMTYQPFLPEVMAGSIEPRHSVVSLRRHLRRTEVVAGTVTAIDHSQKRATVRPAMGPDFDFSYDIIVVTVGAVTRTFPIAGIAEQAIGLKYIEEAIAVRNRLFAAFDQASNLPAGPERRRLLTVTFVGAGFAGVEGFGELLSFSDGPSAFLSEAAAQ